MNIVQLKDGRAINTDHIVQYTHLRNGGIRFLLSTGGEVEGDAWSDPAERMLPVIPANPGFVAVYGEKLTDGTFLYKRRTVIAWQVCPAGNFPVFEGCHRDDNCEFQVLIDPDGGVFDSEGNMLPSLQEWKREFEEENTNVREAA